MNIRTIVIEILNISINYREKMFNESLRIKATKNFEPLVNYSNGMMKHIDIFNDKMKAVISGEKPLKFYNLKNIKNIRDIK